MQLLGREKSLFPQFADVPIHIFHMRSMSWFLVLLVPTAGMVLDVTGKVYSNMFFPTQTQIHVERCSKGVDGYTSNDEEAHQNDNKSNV
jgi:hypothetical protein